MLLTPAAPSAFFSRQHLLALLLASTLVGSFTGSLRAQTSPGYRGATMPYTRYESESGTYGTGAVLRTSASFNYQQTASEASNQAYVALPTSGAYVQWTVAQGSGGAGVNMRFTMPDTSDGMGQSGSLDCYVNGTKVQTISLSSYWSWQYFVIGSGALQDASAGSSIAAFKFDEVHWKLATPLVAGDTIRIQSSGAGGFEYGVDFLEIEPVPAAISAPANSLSVVAYGATPDDGTDDLVAFQNCVTAAIAQGKSVYIPAGKFNLGDMWRIGSVGSPLNNLTITGAGIWYTTLQFTNSASSHGGVSLHMAASGTLDFSNMYLNSNLRSRYNQAAVYKCFMDDFGTNSHIHDFWEEHFECGFWVADYEHTPAIPADGLLIENGRIRNNLADGVNFCQGTKNSTVQNCSVRNNGDDGLAMWPDSTNNAPMEVNNTFSHNTVENGWRASGIAIFGGSGHKAQFNVVKDGFMSAGLRISSEFPGFHFESNTGVLVSDTTFIHCGTSQDIFNAERGAIELEANTTSIRNVTFTNIDILNTQRDAIQVGLNNGFSNVVFNNVHIDGTGLDATTTSHFAAAHGGAALFSYTATGALTFNDLSYLNVENATPLIIPSGFSVTQNVTFVVPAITTQPASQTVAAGASASFTAAASGNPTVTLQWQRLPVGSGSWANLSDGGNYAGSTTGTLTVNGTTTGMSGDQFRCVATNYVGSVTSTSATLSVLIAPYNAFISITIN